MYIYRFWQKLPKTINLFNKQIPNKLLHWAAKVQWINCSWLSSDQFSVMWCFEHHVMTLVSCDDRPASVADLRLPPHRLPALYHRGGDLGVVHRLQVPEHPPVGQLRPREHGEGFGIGWRGSHCHRCPRLPVLHYRVEHGRSNLALRQVGSYRFISSVDLELDLFARYLKSIFFLKCILGIFLKITWLSDVVNHAISHTMNRSTASAC